MTEEEWLASADSAAMMRFLRQEKLPPRKLRCLAAACFESASSLLRDPWQQTAIEALATLVDSPMDEDDYRKITSHLRSAIPHDQWRDGELRTNDLHFAALMLYREFASRRPSSHAIEVASAFRDGKPEWAYQAGFIRDIFGNPFRPVPFDPAWRTETAIGLARGIYDDRAFDRMPILADAIQDAGCEDEAILSHCRVDGPHVRGCWVVDLVLGKE